MTRFNRIRRVAAFLMLMLFSVTVFAPIAMADERKGEIKISDGQGGEKTCEGDGKLLARIVPCIRQTIEETTSRMTNQFGQHVQPMAWAFATLVVAIFGIRVLQGDAEVEKTGLKLLLKIGIMAVFIVDFGGMIPAAFGSIQDGAEIVTNALYQEGQCNDSGGGGGGGGGGGQYGSDKMWGTMDCILGHMFGFAPGFVMGSSIAGVAFSALTTTSFGAILASTGTMMLVMLMMLILRSAYYYLMAHIFVGFLIVFSPLLVPLLLLSVTFEYFQRYLQMIIAGIVQPIMIMAYLALALMILDKVLYDDNNGVFKKLDKDTVEKGWRSPISNYGMTSCNNASAHYGKMGVSGYEEKDYARDIMYKPCSGQARLESPQMPQFDWGKENNKKSNEGAKSILFAAITIYLLYEMLNRMPHLCQSITQAGLALITAGSTTGLEGQMQDKMSQGYGTVFNTLQKLGKKAGGGG